MSPIVSIILPCHNDLSYLETTLKSITSQTFTNFELLIVDDGSIDETQTRLRGMIAADTRLRYIRRAHGGVGAARNTGIDQACGRYLSFVDADDLLHPAFLHTLVSTAESSKADIVQCYMHSFTDGHPCTFPQTYTVANRFMNGPEALQQLLTGELPSGVCNRLYRKDIISNCRFMEGCLYEDLEFSVRLLPKLSKLQIVPLALYGYRQRQHGLRAQTAATAIDDRIRVLRQIRWNLDRLGLWPARLAEFQQLTIRFVGNDGFNDLIRAGSCDQGLYLRLLDCLKQDGQLTLGALRKLPATKEARQRVTLALLHPKPGHWLLAWQARKQARPVTGQGMPG